MRHYQRLSRVGQKAASCPGLNQRMNIARMGESHAWVFWGRRVALSYSQGSTGC